MPDISLMGATYSDVPGVELPTSGGGTAYFVDTSSDTVTASALSQGVTAHNAAGEPIIGTGSIGGGGAFDLGEYNNSGSHNAVYRGKSLGSSVTAAQLAAIADGSFDDLFIGDYWTVPITIGGTTTNEIFYAADCNYLLNTGISGQEVLTPHLLVVSDGCLGEGLMYNSVTTASGYAGAPLRSNNAGTTMRAIRDAIETAFGSNHILRYYDTLSNATSDGKVTGITEVEVYIEMMSEAMVYGSQWFEAQATGSGLPTTQYTKKTQLSLFRYRPDLISCLQTYWLQNPTSNGTFARVNGAGRTYCANANTKAGIRPYFLLYGGTNE